MIEATKHDSDKPRLELIDPTFIEGLGRVLAFGAKKYEAFNWAKGFEWLRLCGSLLRHTFAFMRGEDLDPESGMPHVDHIACNAMFLSAHFHRGLGSDNRFRNGHTITRGTVTDAHGNTKELSYRVDGRTLEEEIERRKDDPSYHWPRDSNGGTI